MDLFTIPSALTAGRPRARFVRYFVLAGVLCASAAPVWPRQSGQEQAPATPPSTGDELERARTLIDGTADDRMAAADLLAAVMSNAERSGDVGRHAEAALLLGDLVLVKLGRGADEALVHFRLAAGLFMQLDRLASAARATTLSGIALRRLGRIAEAEAAHREALALYDREHDALGRAAVLHNLGAVRFSQNAYDDALAQYRESIAIRRAHGEVALTVSSLNNSATIYSHLGRPDSALNASREAFEAARMHGDASGEAYALLGMGTYSYALGELQAAIGYLRVAAGRFEHIGNTSGSGYAMHTLGVVYLDLGHFADAVSALERAVPLRHDDPARLGTTLQSLGNAHRMQGDFERARASIERALTLKRQASDRYGEAATLRSLAWLELAAARPEQARAHAAASLALSRDVDRTAGVARSLVVLSRAHDSAPDPSVVAELDRAIETTAAARTPQTEAAVRAERARVALATGDLAMARLQAEAAIAATEQVRGGVASLESRATYMAGHADVLDLQVEILLASHRAAPDAGYERAAFEAADRARGRRLLDALGDAMMPRPDDNPARARELDLERDVNVAAVALGRAPDTDRARIQADLDARLLALREFRAEARARLPWRRATPAPDLASLQRTLSGDTTVVAYWFGRAQAVAWVVTPARVTLIDLSSAPVIRTAVSHAYDAFARETGDGDRERALAHLASLVLHPIEPHVETTRLAVVLDGALEYIPLAALPLASGAGPLIARVEVLRLPTATALSGLAARNVSGRDVRIAVLADPVFSTSDARFAKPVAPERLETHVAAAPVVTRGPAGGTLTPARLAFSRTEADAIAGVATRASVLTGFDASKAALAGLPLTGIDVLHLATHAEQHAVRPELSSVILALVDRDGRAIDGRLRLHEVVGLPLSGQLVVLSACHTVIGPDLRGEGLQGLAGAFLQAGARAVVASLWDVDDRATMRLMQHFYQALVRDGRGPERALADAQRAMRRDARWRDPRHWAGFVVLGVGA
ncbi:MAG: CHAT domain-containing protein [Acidobacteria bacterium]|nr:CHAT domain-containing protein [Acidobacteriota bacterium]